MRPKTTTSARGRHVCEQCGDRFDRTLSGSRPIRFCDQRCYHAWRRANGITTGQFRPGQVPWNRDLKGIHLSPGTEFQPGRTTDRLVPSGTLRVRKAKSGQRRFIKTEAGWTEYAKWLWIAHYGPLLPGDVVHHLNGDRLDDHIENLIALPRADHPKFHSRWGLRPLSEDELSAYLSRYAPMLTDVAVQDAPAQPELFGESAG